MWDIPENSDPASSLQAALDSTDNSVIQPGSGIFKGQFEIRRNGITLLGKDPTRTILTGGLYAKKKHPFLDEPLGTFRSYTLLIYADDITLKGLTVENTAGFGDGIGQAVALYAEGNSITVENCILKGRQDTLFTGPLPPKEIEPGGFRGPTEKAPRIQGHQLYKNCYIEGDVDFIFGSAHAEFENCHIHSLDRGKEINGFITAPSTPEGAEIGYVFRNCTFTSDCPVNSVYVGRPWREYAKATFIDCEFGAHIKKELVHDWNKPLAHKYSRFEFIHCRFNGSILERSSDFVSIID
ncbi:MAG: pectin methylesterase [Oscillospiraceae bacterium]|nr:pectin methylesterase [Oscillospiraceae bacterium]